MEVRNRTRTNVTYTILIIGLFTGWAFATTELNSTNAGNIETDEFKIEPINNSANYRYYLKKGKEDKPWFDGREYHCLRKVNKESCQPIRNGTTCFGSILPYSMTSMDLTDLYTQEESHDRLVVYQEIFKYVPKCWPVIQPFLCAVFLPQCERGYVYLPSFEMCKLAMDHCSTMYDKNFLPNYLKCDEKLFPKECKNELRKVKFNGTGQCMAPLVASESSSYRGIEGCGLECKDPLYTDDEHRQIQKLIAWAATACLLCNVFVIATFLIDWSNSNKYPALTVFYMNVCYFICCLGWLAQFTPGGREDVVCKKDGTLRKSEPSTGENLSCIVVFVLVYYFLIAAMVWFVILTYALHMKAIDKGQDRIDKKISYFHLVAWSLPLILTISIMALSEVDASSVAGICFVGYQNHAMRAGFVIGPLICVCLIGGYFVVRGLTMLFDLKQFVNDIKSSTDGNKIHSIIVRMSICTGFLIVVMAVSLVAHTNEFRNKKLWDDSLRNYIMCKMSSNSDNPFTNPHTKCRIESRPSVALLQLHLLCLFGAGIVMSSWCWTSSSLETWKRYFRKKFGKDASEDVKIQKHKLIREIYAKRQELQDNGRLSISFPRVQKDPVGLNFELNDLISTGTNAITSSWFNYLPDLVRRRTALTGATNSSSCGPRKSSVDSEISFSVCRVSLGSRRNSGESQVSLNIAEMKAMVASRSKHSNKTRTRTHKRKDIFTRASRRFQRRERSTSVESQIALDMKKAKVRYMAKEKHMERRTANAGIVPEQIYNILNNGKLFLQGMTTSDEDVSLHMQESHCDAIVQMEHTGSISDDDTQRFAIQDQKFYTAHAELTEKKCKQDDMNNSSNQSSFCSSDFGVEQRKYVQSSVSAISLGDRKTQSRGSKRSCDIGIQTDAHEIVNQPLLNGDNLKLSGSMHQNNFSNLKSDDLESCTEYHKLLPQSKKPMIVSSSALNNYRDRNTLSLSESEKLKKLLLPSK